MPRPRSRPGSVPLGRALSKLGILSRSRAIAAILDGRVSVDGRQVRDPGARVDPARARIALDGAARAGVPWRMVMLNKPRGVVTTARDPEGRPTVFSLLDEADRTLAAVGRLDRATTGLLLLTSDTELAGWLTDPANAVPRVYVVTVRGLVTPEDAAGMERTAASVVRRKVSRRESHLTIELREGKNREVRRLCEAAGHEVTRLKRVAFGGLQLGDLAPGQWREITLDEIRTTFPSAPIKM